MGRGGGGGSPPPFPFFFFLLIMDTSADSYMCSSSLKLILLMASGSGGSGLMSLPPPPPPLPVWRTDFTSIKSLSSSLSLSLSLSFTYTSLLLTPFLCGLLPLTLAAVAPFRAAGLGSGRGRFDVVGGVCFAGVSSGLSSGNGGCLACFFFFLSAIEYWGVMDGEDDASWLLLL